MLRGRGLSSALSRWMRDGKSLNECDYEKCMKARGGWVRSLGVIWAEHCRIGDRQLSSSKVQLRAESAAETDEETRVTGIIKEEAVRTGARKYPGRLKKGQSSFGSGPLPIGARRGGFNPQHQSSRRPERKDNGAWQTWSVPGGREENNDRQRQRRNGFDSAQQYHQRRGPGEHMGATISRGVRKDVGPGRPWDQGEWKPQTKIVADLEDGLEEPIGVGKSISTGRKPWGKHGKFGVGMEGGSHGKSWQKRPIRHNKAENGIKTKQKMKATKPVSLAMPDIPKIITVPADVTVIKFAKLMGCSSSEIERILSDIGESAQSIEDSVSTEAAELVAMELGKSINIIGKSKKRTSDSIGVMRPAVITVMGHVDHGKTTLLDALRSTSVAAREAGGITQHVGAFEVLMPESGKSLTFIDTPGHAAFTAMRARGAAVTDIVVLVVAADDGVMPQTIEAYNHAKAAGCPVVVAITKCDVPGANPEQVKKQIADLGVEIEDYGGSVQVVQVAAPQKMGLNDLETSLLLEAEILDLKAPLDTHATGTVVESRVDKGQGPIATVIVTGGILRKGQSIVVGEQWGRVRLLKDPSGKEIGVDGVPPGKPVEVVGLRGTPNAGDDLLVVATDERAQKISKARSIRAAQEKEGIAVRESWNSKEEPKAGEEDGAEEEEEGPKVLPVIIKADTRGSAEAVEESLTSLSNDSVKIHVVHAGVGPVSASDVALAIPFGGLIVGFNVKSASEAERDAKKGGVKITCRRIIYELIDDMESIIDGATPKTPEEVVIGNAEVLALFKVPGKKSSAKTMVAGCRVNDGTLKLGTVAKVYRSGDVVFEGPIRSLKRHKLDVETVGRGTECGIGLDGWEGFMVGDSITCVDMQ